MPAKRSHHIRDTKHASKVTKRRYHAPFRKLGMEKTRKQILDAAAILLRADGPDKLTFDAVARRAQVSLRTLFRHFPNREALLDAAAASCMAAHDAQHADWQALLNHAANLTQSLGELAKSVELSDDCLARIPELLRTRPTDSKAMLVSLLLSPFAWHFLERRHALAHEQTHSCIADGLELLGIDLRPTSPAATYSDDEFID